MHDRMALFYCEAGRLGSFQRGVSGLGLPIDPEPKSTLGLLVLGRGRLLSIAIAAVARDRNGRRVELAQSQ